MTAPLWAAEIRGSSRENSSSWTPDEIEFLRQNSNRMTTKELGRRLGRKRGSVAYKIYKLGLPSFHKNQSKFTTTQVGHILSVQAGTVRRWQEAGLLPKELIPGTNHYWISFRALALWCTNPMNFPYFRFDLYTDEPRPILDYRLQKLVEKAEQDWGDAWMSTAQARDFCGYASPSNIHYYIMTNAFKTVVLHQKYWLLRSEVIAFALAQPSCPRHAEIAAVFGAAPPAAWGQLISSKESSQSSPNQPPDEAATIKTSGVEAGENVA